MDFNKLKELYPDMSTLIGKTFWVCDYRHYNILENPTRPILHLEPTEAVLEEVENVPGKYVFREIGASGRLLNKTIPIYDRTNRRIPINVFMNEEDCVDFFKKQCKLVKENLENENTRIKERYDKMKTHPPKIVVRFLR